MKRRKRIESINVFYNRQSEIRKVRGLAVAAAGLVEQIEKDRYRVHSQTSLDRTLKYAVDYYAKTCTCPDFDRHGHEFWCKHLWAVHVYRLAEQAAPELARQKNESMEELESQLLYQLATPAAVDGRFANKLLVLLHAVQHLLNEQPPATAEKPAHIDLIIECQTTGGKNFARASEGHILKVIADGHECSDLLEIDTETGEISRPEAWTPNAIIDWIMRENYKVLSHKWISAPGYLRRRKLSYSL